MVGEGGGVGMEVWGEVDDGWGEESGEETEGAGEVGGGGSGGGGWAWGGVGGWGGDEEERVGEMTSGV